MLDFKIVAEGTHGSMGLGKEAEGPAEGSASGEQPANNEPPAQDPPPPPADTATDPPAEANGEQPQEKTHSAKLTVDKKEATPNDQLAPPTPTAQGTPPAPPAINWNEISIEDALKAKGLDENFINLAKVYQQTGKLDRYVEAMQMDFSKMTPEQGMRYHLQREYPTATSEQLELLYDTEVQDKYKLNADLYDPESKEAKAAQVKLQMDWQKLSSQYTDEMGKHKLPSFDPTEQYKKQAEEEQQSIDKTTTLFKENEFTKKVVTDKKITLGDLSYKGEDGKEIKIPDFNLELEDPEEIVGIMTDTNTYKKYAVDSKGELNTQSLMLDGAFMSNRSGFMRTLINYGMMLGREQKVEEAYNPPKPDGAVASPAKESLKEAFANRGKDGRG